MIETNYILHSTSHAFGQVFPCRSTVPHPGWVGIVLKNKTKQKQKQKQKTKTNKQTNKQTNTQTNKHKTKKNKNKNKTKQNKTKQNKTKQKQKQNFATMALPLHDISASFYREQFIEITKYKDSQERYKCLTMVVT